VPAALVGTLLVGYDYYDRERTRLIRDSLSTTRALAAAVDTEFAVVQAAMLALAGSRRITEGDFRTLHAEALGLIEELNTRNRSSLINIILADPTGRQLFNTFRPYGEPLPTSGDPGGLARALQTDAPIVSDLFVGPVIKRPGIGVTVPVKRAGRNLYRLTAGVSTDRLSALLKQQQLPEAWIAVVLDRSGTIVARSHDEARFLGQTGSPELVARLKQTREDSFDSRTLDGIPVLTVFSRSPVSGYTVALGIPQRELAANLFSSIARLFIVAFIVLLSALGLAVLLARRLLPRQA
jgi:hypothetical protein